MAVHVLSIHVGRDWKCKLLFIVLECDLVSSHMGEGKVGQAEGCSSCLKLCTKLSDQTSRFDWKSALFSCPSL